MTRRNDRTLVDDHGEPVRNRESWHLDHVHPDGSLTVTRTTGPGRVRLPADYVQEHVRLGYAATAHGHQGDTVDVSYTLVSTATTHRGLYVGATRGRHDNQLHVITDTPDLGASHRHPRMGPHQRPRRHPRRRPAPPAHRSRPPSANPVARGPARRRPPSRHRRPPPRRPLRASRRGHPPTPHPGHHPAPRARTSGRRRPGPGNAAATTNPSSPPARTSRLPPPATRRPSMPPNPPARPCPGPSATGTGSTNNSTPNACASASTTSPADPPSNKNHPASASDPADDQRRSRRRAIGDTADHPDNGTSERPFPGVGRSGAHRRRAARPAPRPPSQRDACDASGGVVRVPLPYARSLIAGSSAPTASPTGSRERRVPRRQPVGPPASRTSVLAGADRSWNVKRDRFGCLPHHLSCGT